MAKYQIQNMNTKKAYRFCFKRKKYDMNYVFGIKIN